MQLEIAGRGRGRRSEVSKGDQSLTSDRICQLHGSAYVILMDEANGPERVQGSANAVTEEQFGLGLIGCGSFGNFCLRIFTSMPGIRPTAVTGILPEPARRTGEAFGLPVCKDIHELAAREDIQVIHIATPPSTHPELAIAALRAGKNVLCEKPLATSLADANRMVQEAKAAGRFLAVNLIMRYNPLNQAVQRILRTGLLGAPIHASFENDAGDTLLGPNHWFWDRKVSGGIFIEHGVHFFDLFQMWFGPGELVSAVTSKRPDSADIIDQVECTASYPGGLLANFYHGFHQANRVEKQETRIVCERGTIRLLEWISTSIEIDLLALKNDLDTLVSLVPNAEVEEIARYQGEEREILARNKKFQADGRYRIRGHAGKLKMDLYAQLICALLKDQIQVVHDPHHQRLVTEENGISSLAMAVRATELAGHGL